MTMTRHLCAAVLLLLSVAGIGRAGEKSIIERLEKAGAMTTASAMIAVESAARKNFV